MFNFLLLKLNDIAAAATTTTTNPFVPSNLG
jgi:hypothetical protein